jgi:hypothetical protein
LAGSIALRLRQGKIVMAGSMGWCITAHHMIDRKQKERPENIIERHTFNDLLPPTRSYLITSCSV